MKSLKYIAASLILAISAFLPIASVHAAGGSVTTVLGYVDGSTLHVEGEATPGTDVVAINIYNEAGTSLVAGPETTETDASDYTFSYDFAGTFSADTVYTICAADYDGGGCVPTKTVKLIKSLEVTVKPPKIGDTVTLVDQGGWDEPDKTPSVSVKGDKATVPLAVWANAAHDDYFAGTFEANKDYYAHVELEVPDETYIFANDLTVTLKGGGVLADDVDVYPDRDFAVIFVKIKPTVDGEEAGTTPTPDTGTTPKASDNVEAEGIATQNMSLGASIIVASAIVYGTYLITRQKAEARR